MVFNFISPKDSDENGTMHTKIDNTEIMLGSEVDEIIKKLLESLLQKYQEGLEDKMRGSEFAFDSVDLLHCNFHKIVLNRGGSNIDFPIWLKNKTATINSKNNDDKCFQYAVTAALNYQNIKNDPQGISKIKSFF